VHKVTKSTPRTRSFIKIPTPGLSKVGDGTVLDAHLFAIIESATHNVESIRRLFLILKFAVHMTNHVISQIITDTKTINSTELAQLLVHVFEKDQKVLLGLRFVHLRTERFGILTSGEGPELRLANGVAKDVFDENGAGEGWFVVRSGAAVSMTAGPDFEVEGTVYFVFFCAVDSCESLRHFGLIGSISMGVQLLLVSFDILSVVQIIVFIG
jgi:hypothetical protein